VVAHVEDVVDRLEVADAVPVLELVYLGEHPPG
jgi:hypothetical protein